MALDVLCSVCQKNRMTTDSPRHNRWIVQTGERSSVGVCSQECYDRTQDPQLNLPFIEASNKR